MISQPSAVLALAILSFILTVIWGTPLIRLMKWIKVGDNIRIELSNKIQEKAGTPTMGGVMFVLPVLLLTVIINAVSLINPEIGGRSVMVPLFTMIAFAFLGGIDDWEKLKNKAAGEGMKARTKFLIQFLITLGIAYTLYAILDVPHLFIPGYPLEINLGWFYIPIAMFIIIGSANAVNFTDGFDGLAGLIAATCFAAYGGVALIQGQTFLAQFCFTLVGALFGFLWFNVHPAQLFMGDTGSMPLGAVLGVVSLMTGQWILLPVIAIIPVSEILSVIIQVIYFRVTGGKRVFKMSPIHYHFELSGWSETQIVQRFWLISLMAAIIGVALAVI
ncbi:MAG: phospho-N-acetylmuramoyl-pentapeptide-transferase [Chloroflexi bacterium]|jgi:phospho-N-acetylmuramoyl-pentapeptide-transferase|nr:phospho-N-acetylmuramoyl-pentapeptide-transferase [Chloroflexota bacterium]MBT3670725.1 phospho-N-acetylmuramoyl-pentapeptide-transferase [Chloroflexota bacterium]MBT4003273.1 phospho-N-acetylmuramoyl-pentapeptide-transferase [Chloroflexota bacterium]MBT4305094.1 phospho-N-acetylmuramoyl-pentapeptide-transferase [Chloroflexota bacterium]MBT4533385.1 phospho-N-acetylmuramoyl-pentapeptide-transferase [Chloroflexota bacterium]